MEKDLPKKSPPKFPKFPKPNKFVKPKFVVRRGMAKVPLVKTNTGSTEVLELLAASPAEVAVAVEEELTLTLTEGTLVLVVTRLEVERPPETVRPRRVPRTRQIGNKERKRGVQSTCNNLILSP